MDKNYRVKYRKYTNYKLQTSKSEDSERKNSKFNMSKSSTYHSKIIQTVFYFSLWKQIIKLAYQKLWARWGSPEIMSLFKWFKQYYNQYYKTLIPNRKPVGYVLLTQHSIKTAKRNIDLAICFLYAVYFLITAKCAQQGEN